MQLDGLSLLIDPVLRDAINVVIRRNVPPGVPVERLPPITASLVSHNHYDHLDLPTLKDVGAPIVTGLGHTPVFRGSRLSVTELDWSTPDGRYRVPVRVDGRDAKVLVADQGWDAELRSGSTNATTAGWSSRRRTRTGPAGPRPACCPSGSGRRRRSGPR